MEYKYHIFSPYRVCPLGAHVDHQHGIVTGFALTRAWICGLHRMRMVRYTWSHAPLMGLLILTLLKERW